MKNVTIAVAALILCVSTWLASGAEESWEVESLSPGTELEYSVQTGSVVGTNGVLVNYGGAVLTAERVSLNQKSGEATAHGKVRIQRDNQIWAGDHIRYNFKTRVMESGEFRTGRAPVFAGGQGLNADVSNQVYYATNAIITADDIREPLLHVRASKLKIIPGKSFTAHNAVLCVGKVPVFYFPYYHRTLDPRANHFNFTPGYRSSYGPFLLTSYEWFLGGQFDGALHLDYRAKRGVGLGPDVNYHLGRWGDGSFRYYHLSDQEPNENADDGADIPEDRRRVHATYLANPYTNLWARGVYRYQSDSNIIRDFFEGEHRANPQPNSYFELEKFWSNFSLETYVQPQVNEFYDTVERLPEVRLTGYRQQLGATPFFYESQSSLGYYERRFAETNGFMPPEFSAPRADTFHQILLPHTFFGWLNFTPRVGGRATYYGEAHGDGGTTDEQTREVLNTGAELSFKLSRVWTDAESKLFDVHSLRHIAEPSVNYSYVADPNHDPSALPQFDYELPSLRLLPIDFPDYNAVDSIDEQNVLRFGLRNRLQTRRNNAIENLLSWDLATNWRLGQENSQATTSDVFSDLTFKPRSWLTLESNIRYATTDKDIRVAFHGLTLQPNDRWSWGVSHFFTRNDPILGPGNDQIRNTVFLRLNENWGGRLTHHVDIHDGRMREQIYTVYRDLRSWTASLSFRVSDRQNRSDDVTLAFIFSLKAMPRFGIGSDAVRPYSLLGG